jgi:hypothetical protein
MSEEDKLHLRAIYAGLAMTKLLEPNDSILQYEVVASRCFNMADAMIKQLDPQEGIAKARRKTIG